MRRTIESTPWFVAATLILLAVPTSRVNSTPSAQATNASGDRVPVLVELFTSEGCSSCPPADELLSQIQREQPIAGVQIIGFEEHVDYWNHDGWMDPYSAAEWTIRQQGYTARFKSDSPYTPQMIVDGQREFVGNNAGSALEVIRQSAQQQKTSVAIGPATTTKGDVQRFEIRVGNIPASGGADKADVWLAVCEEGLRGDAKAGENGGKTWQHAAIVRSMQKIGAASANSTEPLVIAQQIKLKSNWKRDNLRVVVFVQERKSWRILGVGSGKIVN